MPFSPGAAAPEWPKYLLTNVFDIYLFQGEFSSAVDCYTKCIELFSDRIAPYTNRALCYLRLNKVGIVLMIVTKMRLLRSLLLSQIGVPGQPILLMVYVSDYRFCNLEPSFTDYILFIQSVLHQKNDNDFERHVFMSCDSIVLMLSWPRGFFAPAQNVLN